VVEVEQRPLRSFEQDSPALAKRAVDEQGRVGDVRAQPDGAGLHALGQLLDRERRDLVDALEDEVLLRERGLEFLPEDLRVEDVLDANADARGLVRVGGTDSSPRRPDLEPAEPPLAGGVDGDVPRHDQVRVPGDAHALSGDAAALERVQLGDEEPGVDDAAGAHDAELPGEDSGRDVVEGERLAVADDRVAGVGAALVAAHDVGVLGEQVDDLALPLVAPLGADDHGCWHRLELSGRGSRWSLVHMACGEASTKVARRA
jgi:hypothetical protein